MTHCAGRKGAVAVEAENGSAAETVRRAEAVIAGGGFETCWGSVIGMLGLIVRRAFEEFSRSKEPLETRTTTTRTRQTRHGVEVTETVTVRRAERAGDVKILRVLLQCLDRKIRLLKERHGDPKDCVTDLRAVSDAELEALDELEGLEVADDQSDVSGAAEVPQNSGPAGEPASVVGGVAANTPDGNTLGKETSRGAAASKVDLGANPQTRDNESLRGSATESPAVSPTPPGVVELLAADQKDKPGERLEGRLRQTEASRPPALSQPARSPAAPSTATALASG